MEYLVIGGGPAGLQLGYFLQRAGRDYKILEAGPAAGSFFETFPRHRKLISINKPNTGTADPELNLRMDWNSLLSDDPDLLFTKYTPKYFPDADDMVRYLQDFAVKTDLNIQYDTRVRRIDRGFRVTDQRGEVHEADRLIVSTGPSKPFLPPIPGIVMAEHYNTVSTDPQDFLNQRVLIIGKGNSAFETADNLVETAAVIHVVGRSSIRMAWKTHYVGHLRAVNNNFLDTYQLKSQNAVLDGNVVNIAKDDEGYLVTVSFSRADEVTKDIRYDRVIVCTGFRADTALFADDCRPELVIDDRFPALTPEWESVNVPGLYFAGTLMQSRDFKKSTSGFIHGFRYCVRSLHRVLERKYHGVEWPGTTLPNRPDSIASAILKRVNRSSALWQQFGHLGDLVVTNGDHATYHEELPVAGMPATGFVVTLEYGPDHDKVDPFDITVRRPAQNAPEQAFDAAYLHPVIRCYRGGELVGTHHVAENLENDWTGREAHRLPLERFLARQLAVPSIA